MTLNLLYYSISKILFKSFFAYLQTFNEAVFTFRLVCSLGLSKIENFCLVALLEELTWIIGPATNWVGIEVAVLPPVKSRLLCERSMMIEFRHRHFLMLPMSSNAMLQCSNQGFIEQSLGHLVFCQNDSPIGGSFEQKDSLITHILFELCLFWYLAQSK